MIYPLNFPEISSERLVLRQLTLNDAAAILGLRSNQEINKLITRETPDTLEEATAFIHVCHSEFANGNRVFWAMELKESKQVVGTIVFHNIQGTKSYAEIGYELHPDFHKKGLMKEAMKTILSFGINTMELKAIEAFTHKNNSGSIGLLEKHNFVIQPNSSDEGFDNNRVFRFEINQ